MHPISEGIRMHQEFVQFDTVAVKGGVVVMDLQGVDGAFDLTDGASVQASFPATAAFHFNPSFKRNKQLADCLVNVEGMMVCSARLKAFIESKMAEGLEYLPVRLVDLEGRVVPDPYFIIHTIEHVDCIDLAKSSVTWSTIDPTSIRFAKHIELDPARVPDRRLIFRPRSFPGLLLVRRDLADEIEQLGFSGIRCRPID